MVWVCSSLYGVGPIHLIEKTMIKEIYRDILNIVMYPYADDNIILKFQQDNDPKHTPKCVREWFKINKVSKRFKLATTVSRLKRLHYFYRNSF